MKSQTKFKVNMHCASCAINIEKALKKINCSVESNPVFKIVKVEHDSSISKQDIKDKLKEVGYDAEEIN